MNDTNTEPLSLETILKRLLVAHAVREAAAVRNFRHVREHLLRNPPPWVPGGEAAHLDHEVCEEQAHFEAVRAVLIGYVGRANAKMLLRSGFKRGAEVMPQPDSLMKHYASMLIVDRAGRIGMECVIGCCYSPYGDCVRGIVGEEREHGDHAREVLRLALAHDPNNRELLKQALRDYGVIAYRCFGKPDSAADAYALAIGFKDRSARENIRRFDEELAPILAEFGLPADLLDPYRW